MNGKYKKMNKQSLGLAIMLFAVVLTACAQQKKTTADKAAVTGNPITEKTKKVPKRPPAINYMAMERTACFGKCPTYMVELYSTGLVRYTSRMFTEHEGVFEKNVGAEKTQSLMDQFSKNRVDTCSENYNALIQDLPGIVYTFKYGKTTQKIYNANFGPDYLNKLSKKVDELAQIDNTWKKVADQPKR